MSHPTRGEWIEIICKRVVFMKLWGPHPTRGEWIEIEWLRASRKCLKRHTLHGVCGLKWFSLSINSLRGSHTPHGGVD